jgi:hypothetical protein
MLLVTIEKFDPNLVLVNINKLKPLWLVDNHTLLPIQVKPNDLLPKELVETNNYGNLFIKELIETNYPNSLFIKEHDESHPRGITINKLVKKITSCNLSNQELLEESTNNLLKNQSIDKTLVSHILTQTKYVSINLVTNVSFLEKVYPKGHIVFQAPPPFTLWL